MASKSKSTTARTTSAHTNLTAESKWSISREVREEITGRVAEAKRSGAQARYLMAQATHLVVSHDAIGEGRLYGSQDDYAAALGVSKSTVTGLKYLGRVIAETGVTPDHKDWGVLSSGAGNLGKYLKGAKSVSVTGAVKAVRAAKPAAPRKVSPASEPGTPDLSRFESLQAVLTQVRESIPALDRAESHIVRNSLSTILAEVQEHLKNLPREESTGTDG